MEGLFHTTHSHPEKRVAGGRSKAKSVTGFKEELETFLEDRPIDGYEPRRPGMEPHALGIPKPPPARSREGKTGGGSLQNCPVLCTPPESLVLVTVRPWSHPVWHLSCSPLERLQELSNCLAGPQLHSPSRGSALTPPAPQCPLGLFLAQHEARRTVRASVTIWLSPGLH